MGQKINIDFEIKSDLYYIKVFDFSVWGLIDSKPAVIEITLPGFTTPKVKYFDKHKVNIFSSILLDSDCVECQNETPSVLQDGIYVVKVKGSPETYNKELKYLKTDSIQMDIDRIYIDGISGNTDYDLIMEKLSFIEFLLKGAEAHLRYDMERECRMLFEQAQRLTKDLIECKECY